jgi:hypothetical protein
MARQRSPGSEAELRKLQNTPDLSRDDSLVKLQSPKASRPSTPSKQMASQASACTAPSAAPWQPGLPCLDIVPISSKVEAAAPSEKKRVLLPEDAGISKSPAPALPLVVDSRVRTSPEPTLAEKAAVAPLATKLEDDANPFGGATSPSASPWPEIMKSGGPSCAGPRSTGHAPVARKKSLHEPLGDVLLLGAGLRPALADQADVFVTQPGSKEPRSGKDAPVVSPSIGEDVSLPSGSPVLSPSGPDDAAVPASSEGSALSPTDGIAPPAATSSASLTPTVMVASQALSICSDATLLPATEWPASASDDAIKPSAQSLPPVSQHSAASNPCRSFTSRGSEASSLQSATQELATSIQVSTQDAALQTDAPWTDMGLATMKAKASTPRDPRILILQRCDRRQVDLSKWNPTEKSESFYPPEIRYLAHVRSRFPGTIEGGCRLATKATDRRSATPQMATLT